MEREYIAFISYRHLPLDMDIAKQLHKMIEHYNVPQKYRKDGRKTPGIVFRDQDELPLSSDLSGSIQTALDHSQFLILISTPDWGKSEWCREELAYFLKTHDRDHVLVVHAAGEPAQVIPEELLNVRDEEGNIIRRSEPLCAGVAAPGATARHRLLKREGLRIIAALIGCAFDELRQREKRYQRRKRIAAVSVIGMVLTAFIIVLAVKNAQVQAQYERAEEQRQRAVQMKNEAQLTESRLVIAEEKENLKAMENRAEAVRNTAAVLPNASDPERPYYPGAEQVLTQALRVYDVKTDYWHDAVKAEGEVIAVTISDMNNMVYILDQSGYVYGYDLTFQNRVFRTLLSADFTSGPFVDYIIRVSADGRSLLVGGIYDDQMSTLAVLDARDGTELYVKAYELLEGSFLCAGDDWYAVIEYDRSKQANLTFTLSACIRIYDWRTGELHRTADGAAEEYLYDRKFSYSISGNMLNIYIPEIYDIAVSNTGRYVALYEYCGDEHIRLIDRESGAVRIFASRTFVRNDWRYQTQLAFDRDDRLICLKEENGSSVLAEYDPEGNELPGLGRTFEGTKTISMPMTVYEDQILLLLAVDNEMIICNSATGMMTDVGNCSFMTGDKELPDLLLSTGPIDVNLGNDEIVPAFTIALKNGKIYVALSLPFCVTYVNPAYFTDREIELDIVGCDSEHFAAAAGNTVYIGSEFQGRDPDLSFDLYAGPQQYVLSEDGNTALLCRCLSDGSPEITLADVRDHTVYATFAPDIPAEYLASYWYSSLVGWDQQTGRFTFLCDHGSAGSALVVYDADSGETRMIPLQEHFTVFCDSEELNKGGEIRVLSRPGYSSNVVTFTLIRNGEVITEEKCPVEFDPAYSTAVCGCGNGKMVILTKAGGDPCCLYRGPESTSPWRKITLPFDNVNTNTVSGMSTRDAVAMVAGRSLYIIDPEQPEAAEEYPLPFNATVISSICFIANDTVVLISTSGNDHWLLFTDDGTVIESGLPRDAVAAYDAAEDGSELYFSIYTSYISVDGYIYDLKNRGIRAEVPGMYGYIPAGNELIAIYGTEVYFMPRLSIDELLKMVKPYLN